MSPLRIVGSCFKDIQSYINHSVIICTGPFSPLALCDNLHRAFQSIGYAPGVRNRGECGIALTTTQNLLVIIRCFHADFQNVLTALYIVCNVEPERFPDTFSNSLSIDVHFGVA